MYYFRCVKSNLAAHKHCSISTRILVWREANKWEMTYLRTWIVGSRYPDTPKSCCHGLAKCLHRHGGRYKIIPSHCSARLDNDPQPRGSHLFHLLSVLPSEAMAIPPEEGIPAGAIVAVEQVEIAVA